MATLTKPGQSVTGETPGGAFTDELLDPVTGGGSSPSGGGTEPNNPTINIAAGSNMSGGGDFTLNQATGETISIGLGNNVLVDASVSADGDTLTLTKNDGSTINFTDNSAGGIIPPEHATMTLQSGSQSGSTLVFPGSLAANTTITATFTIDSRYTNMVVTLPPDPSNVRAGPVTGSGNTMQVVFTILININSPFTATLSATVSGEYQGTLHHAQVSSTIRVTTPAEHWYEESAATAPTDLTGATDLGTFDNGTGTVTATKVAGENYYFILPNHSAGYTFTSGQATFDPTDDAITSTAVGSDHQAYTIGTFNSQAAGLNTTFTITEN